MAITKEQIIGWIPKGHKAALSEEDLVLIISQDLSFEITDRGIIVSKDGHEIRNSTTMAPVPPQEVIKNYFTERKWINQAGNQGKQENTAGGKTMSEFKQNWLSENPGKAEVSFEFDLALADHTKDNKDFDWYT